MDGLHVPFRAKPTQKYPIETYFYKERQTDWEGGREMQAPGGGRGRGEPAKRVLRIGSAPAGQQLLV